MITLKQLREKLSLAAFRADRKGTHFNELPKTQKSAVGDYIATGFYPVNQHMYRDGAPPPPDTYTKDGDTVEQEKKRLSSAIKKHTTSTNHYFYRGIAGERLPADWDKNPKASFVHKAFLSTTHRPRKAIDFASSKNATHFVKGKNPAKSAHHVLKIFVPKGTAHFNMGGSEREHILLPGTLTKRKPSTKSGRVIYHHVTYTPAK